MPVRSDDQQIGFPARGFLHETLADAGSRSMLAMPPSANSVMDRTGRPRAVATIACDSSCASSVTKKSTAVSTDEAQIVAIVQSGYVSRKCEPSDSVIRAAMMNQL
jgi:hypothetical protein